MGEEHSYLVPFLERSVHIPCVHWFSISAVTEYHRLNGLNDANLLSYCFGGQKSAMGLTGLTSRCQRGCNPFWRLEKKAIFLPFPASRECLYSLACASFLSSKPVTLHCSDPSSIVRSQVSTTPSVLLRNYVIRLSLLLFCAHAKWAAFCVIL